MKRPAFMIANVIVILAIVAAAQETRSEIAVQGTGQFTNSSSGKDPYASGVTRRADTTGGFLVSYRYRLWRWLAVEGNYGFAPNSLQYSTAYGLYSGDAYMHQATTGVVVNLPATTRFKFSPYLLADGGALIFNPTSSGFRTTGGFSTYPTAARQTKAVFIYGAGADFPLTKRLSFRAEYRRMVYHAPDFGVSTLTTGAVTHTAQPSAGIVFRF